MKIHLKKFWTSILRFGYRIIASALRPLVNLLTLATSKNSQQKLGQKNYFKVPDLNLRPVDYEYNILILASTPRSRGCNLVAQLMLDLPVLIFFIIFHTDTEMRN